MAANHSHQTLGVISLGLAVGVTWALAIAVLTIIAAFTGLGASLAIVLQGLYVGYQPNLVGLFVGIIWGFATGFIFGVMIAWLYNRFLLSRKNRL